MKNVFALFCSMPLTDEIFKSCGDEDNTTSTFGYQTGAKDGDCRLHVKLKRQGPVQKRYFNNYHCYIILYSYP